MSPADANLSALLARARAMRFGPPPGAGATFALAVRPDGSIADDGKPGEADPDEELVAGAVHDILTAAHAAHGRRWAVRGDQDQWHEGDHSEAEAETPVRLDSVVRRVLHTVRASLGDPDPATADTGDPADLSAVRRTPRARLARAAVESMKEWTPAHLCHMFGEEASVADVLDALDRPAPPEPVNYFRRLERGDGVFAVGRTVLAGDALPLSTRRLHTPPTDPRQTRTLYARTTRRYEVPPTDGERAEAHP